MIAMKPSPGHQPSRTGGVPTNPPNQGSAGRKGSSEKAIRDAIFEAIVGIDCRVVEKAHDVADRAMRRIAELPK